jgi:hypothetical protein
MKFAPRNPLRVSSSRERIPSFLLNFLPAGLPAICPPFFRQGFELTLDWIPRDSLNDAATARLFYEVRPTAAASSPESTIPQANGVLSPFPFDFRFSRFARHFRSDLVLLKTYD